MSQISRRTLLATTAIVLFDRADARAGSVSGKLPWHPRAATPPPAVLPGPWVFFTLAEAKAVEAIVDRMIPPDSGAPGGKDVGCAVFIDRQLAGPFGQASSRYKGLPFVKGGEEQGAQSALTPAEQYRRVLVAFDAHSRSRFGGQAFVDLEDANKDKVIASLESGEMQIDGVDTNFFFATLLQNVREGFFCDPIYGGNINMAGWKMIGFPGARYDYSDWIDRHNEPYPHGPLSLAGAPNWSMP